MQTIELRTLSDEDLRWLVVEAVRRAGFRDGARLLGLAPRELARLVCRRGIDLVAELRGDARC